MDLVVKTDLIPKGGETVQGRSFSTVPGGKGANQAVAVSRLGGTVKMVGAIGRDSFGRELINSLETAGVDVTYIVDKKITTGTAFIIVDQRGENRIITVSGANGSIVDKDIENLEELIAGASFVILQFEIPLETNEHIIELALKHKIPVILNPAPPISIPDEIFKKISILIVNETEAEFFSKCIVVDVASGFVAAEALRAKGSKIVIVTLGEQGALVVAENFRYQVPARKVKVVDTTGAGDTFVGAFAVASLEGKTTGEALEYAIKAGTLAVTRFGAQPSIPTKEEVTSFGQLQGARV
jgi:ribokinase